MKKTLLLSLATGLFIFSACDNKPEKNTMSVKIPTYNLVTSIDSSTEPEVVAAIYNYDLDLMESTVAVSSVLNSDISFTTKEVPFKAYYLQSDNVLHEVIKIDEFLAGSTNKGESLNSFNCELTTLANIPPYIMGLPEAFYPTGKYTILSYNVGSKYNVRTFWSDVTFSGNTNTSYVDQNGDNQSYLNKDILYRVVMNIKDKKATVILYNAKFAENMPQSISNIVLKDLPLKFSNYGYSIEGENIIPEIYEGGEATPNTRFVFNKFELSCAGNLVSSNIYFEVAGGFKGSFTGDYVKILKAEGEE